MSVYEHVITVASFIPDLKELPTPPSVIALLELGFQIKELRTIVDEKVLITIYHLRLS